MKFGAFDNVTGLPIAKNNLSKDMCNIGYGFNLVGVANVSLMGSLEINGNDKNMIRGGEYGDRGTQCIHYGFRCIYADTMHIENLYTHHHCLDGFYVGGKRYETMLDMYERNSSRTYINLRSIYNGRNNVTIAGGMNHNFFGGSLSYAGKSVFTTSPASGCDIEAEQGMVRNVNFFGTHLINNHASQLVSDSGDTANVNFFNPVIIGGTGSLWINKPGFTFHGGIISCYLEKTYNGSIGKTVFNDVLFTDDPKINPFAAEIAINNMVYPYSSLFNYCTFDLYKWGMQSASSTETYKDCTVIYNADFSGILGTFIGETNNLTFVDKRTVKSNRTIQVTTGKHKNLKILSGDSAVSGLAFSALYETDIFPSDQNPYKVTSSRLNSSNISKGIVLSKSVNVSSLSDTLSISVGSAIPTDLAFYGEGSIVYNTNSVNNLDQTKEWICTKAGIAISDTQVWQSGITANYPAYRFYGNNVYLNTASGTTGSTPPTHTSGTVSDGSVMWKFLNTRAVFADRYKKVSGLTATSTAADIVTALKNAGLAI